MERLPVAAREEDISRNYKVKADSK